MHGWILLDAACSTEAEIAVRIKRMISMQTKVFRQRMGDDKGEPRARSRAEMSVPL